MTNSKGPSFVRCYQCKLFFSNIDDCVRHAKDTGHAYKPAYFCTACSLSFAKRMSRTNHMKSTGHVQQPPKTFPSLVSTPPVSVPSTGTAAARPAKHTEQPRCTVCQLNFPTKETLQIHYNNSFSHPSCAACELGFESSASLALHKKRCTGLVLKSPVAAVAAEPNAPKGLQATVGSSTTPSTSVLNASALEEEQPYFCNVCFEVIDAAHMIAAHTSATGHDRFAPLIAEVACPDCLQKFKTVVGCENHRRDVHSRPASHTSKPLPSQATAGRTEANRDLQATVTGPPIEETRCDKCNIGFSSPEALQAHYDESPLHPTCHTCGLGFTSIGPWATHKARCPPPGSTAVTSGAVRHHGLAAPSKKGKEVARDVKPTEESSVSEHKFERVTHAEQAQIAAKATDGSGINASAGLSSVTVAPPSTIPSTPETPRPQRTPSPTPSSAVSTASVVTMTYAHSSSQTIDPYAAPRRSHAESVLPPGHSASQVEAGPCSLADDIPPRGPSPAAYPTPLSGRTRTGSPIDLHWDRAATEEAHTPRAPTNRDSDAPAVSFHCRSCLRDPCVQPVATICGHIFCHSCIVQELSTKMCCPVCQKTYFIRLHVEAD
ncbi:hypothetical protein K466DRAFT_513831 [Polyporus arcularius HHB13444]|uniref:RING-type domain-containing protein n=1 Tax=Polyporus arcularius HHB13444 TaxID=1314778 RepID=A0A5C3PV08_9APHY|nr:hypothetical protein K466DRAFT_513831 [Polyporus arcularius HHB13444]